MPSEPTLSWDLNGNFSTADLQSPITLGLPISYFRGIVLSGQSLSNRSLVRTSPDLCRAHGKEVVVDAYCIGTILLFLAEQAKAIHGIEVIPAAIDDARRNARENGIDNARFKVGEVEMVLPELRAQGIQPEVVVLDPPRQGCRPEVLAALASARPERIVYASCNPATLARDLRVLTDEGYLVHKVQPVDMFPQTYHVETVVLLSKTRSTRKRFGWVLFEDMDMSISGWGNPTQTADYVLNIAIKGV